MKKLSVLIPVYNAEKYIANLLDCIIKQIDDRVEIILLNDGSKDASGEICNGYSEKYPNQVYSFSRENKGAVRTRRELLQKAQGEWIWIVDSDDMVVDHAIPTILKKTSTDEPCDMVLFDYYVNEVCSENIFHLLPYEDGYIFEGEQKKELYKRLIGENGLNPLWNKVFKRDCVDFEADYSVYEDVRKANDCLQMLPIITNAKKVKYVREPFYIYNSNNVNSLSHQFHDYTYFSLKKVWMRKKEFLHLWGYWDALKNNYYSFAIKAAIGLLRNYAYSDRTKQEYYQFFDTITNDGVFSEAFQSGENHELSQMDKLAFITIGRKRKRFSYFLFAVQKRRINNHN